MVITITSKLTPKQRRRINDAAALAASDRGAHVMPYVKVGRNQYAPNPRRHGAQTTHISHYMAAHAGAEITWQNVGEA